MSDRFAPPRNVPIERHGVVGDRRTAALVAADGAVDWLCLPDYDAAPVFGALLDAERGGFCRLGPARSEFGRQRYADGSAVLLTSWATPEAELELADAMAWPWDDRGEADGGGDARVLLRHLRCRRGDADCALAVRPHHDFSGDAVAVAVPGGAALDVGGRLLRVWSDRPLDVDANGVSGSFRLGAGEEAWLVLALGNDREGWSRERTRVELARADRYWRDWWDDLAYDGPRGEMVRRSALTIHLLSFASTGSPVAAPTSSLPERIGGDRNYDYRYSWVRDASLSLALLTQLGEIRSGRRYIDCLTTYPTTTDSPLQIVYGVDGRTDLPEHKRFDLAGYRGSLPIRTGNRACSQRQLDSLGFFVECAAVYLDAGGEWRDAYWETVRRAADFTAGHWREPDSGIWESTVERHYVSGKAMAWVALDRAVAIAKRTGHGAETDGWREAAAAIRTEVLDRGWSERLGAFRQSYEGETLDASALLIPIMGLLPADDPRSLATADRIAARLGIDDLVHRYVPGETPGHEDDALPVGEFEGAFLPCTFWLATVYARAGRVSEAAAILDRVEAAAGELGLFAEEIDARSGHFLGNFPLLFSHAEYLRAALALADATGGAGR